MHEETLIWYVAYGCDMWSQQLQAQLDGRDLIHNRQITQPCADVQPARSERAVFIPHALYCSGRNRRWNGALPAIDHAHKEHCNTLGRAWLLSVEQFLHLLRQINNEDSLDIDWQQLRDQGHYHARDRGQGRVAFLGERDGTPMATFTSPLPMDQRRPAAPSEDYLQAWTCGLRECYGLNTVGLRSYFNAIPGIAPALSHGQVQRYRDCALTWACENDGDTPPALSN